MMIFIIFDEIERDFTHYRQQLQEVGFFIRAVWRSMKAKVTASLLAFFDNNF